MDFLVSKILKVHIFQCVTNIFILAFYGYSSNTIIYDDELKTWVITDILPRTSDFKFLKDKYKRLAILKASKLGFSLPTGLNKWLVNETSCNGERELILTKVNGAYFLYEITYKLSSFIVQAWSIYL